jgi:hypothetical protein
VLLFVFPLPVPSVIPLLYIQFKTNVMNLVNIDGDVYEILRKMRYHPEVSLQIQ